MLPILRIIPVGGVLLAIVILLMALTPPGGSQRRSVGPIAGARGPLIDGAEHPEWRQFRMLAALRRAQELEQLRGLRDAPVLETEPPVAPPVPIAVEPPPAAPLAPAVAEPVPAAEPEAKIAALPATRDEAEPDAAAPDAPVPDAAIMPLEIGEASSTELPLKSPEPAAAPPPVIKIERRKPHEIRRRHPGTRQVRVQTKYDPNFNFFAALFGNYKYDASRSKFGDQRYAAPQPSSAQ